MAKYGRLCGLVDRQVKSRRRLGYLVVYMVCSIKILPVRDYKGNVRQQLIVKTKPGAMMQMTLARSSKRTSRTTWLF